MLDPAALESGSNFRAYKEDAEQENTAMWKTTKNS